MSNASNLQNDSSEVKYLGTLSSYCSSLNSRTSEQLQNSSSGFAVIDVPNGAGLPVFTHGTSMERRSMGSKNVL